MTDYSDGKWHGWNGGDCPVHPNSMVECVISTTAKCREHICLAGSLHWAADKGIVAFKVTKEHKQLREYWVNYENRSVLTIRDNDDNETFVNRGYIHMREVE